MKSAQKHLCCSVVLLSFVAACTVTTTGTAPAAPTPTASPTPDTANADAGEPAIEAGPEVMDAAATPDKCGAVPKSLCKTPNPGSVVRGIVHFDPALAKGVDGAKPQLSVFLAHREYAQKEEWLTGGHPHADRILNLDTVDLSKGEVPFAIDLCELGVAMWSEDNCGFNLVTILDTNGNNTDDNFNMIPDVGEAAKMTVVQISCHTASQCLDINLDCTTGQRCVSYGAPGVCKCASTTCDSEGKTCK